MTYVCHPDRDILKTPTSCGAKNSNKVYVPSHLVTWIPHTDRKHLHNSRVNVQEEPENIAYQWNKEKEHTRHKPTGAKQGTMQNVGQDPKIGQNTKKEAPRAATSPHKETDQ